METKDWIVLFVPIVCNGIFLFLFQFYLKRYFEKRDRVRIERVKTFQELYTHAESAQTAMYALLHQKQDDNFTELFNRVAEQIHQLKRFYDATNPGGYLLIGHSESLNKATTPYKYLKPATYRKV